MRAVLTTAFIILSSAAWAQSSGQTAPAGASELNRFVSQANRCPEGLAFNPRTRQCERVVRIQCPEGTALNVQTNECVGRNAFFDQQGFLVGGGIITVGAVGAIILANNGKKRVSP